MKTSQLAKLKPVDFTADCRLMLALQLRLCGQDRK
jgi:hypothetical protein